MEILPCQRWFIGLLFPVWLLMSGLWLSPWRQSLFCTFSFFKRSRGQNTGPAFGSRNLGLGTPGNWGLCRSTGLLIAALPNMRCDSWYYCHKCSRASKPTIAALQIDIAQIGVQRTTRWGVSSFSAWWRASSQYLSKTTHSTNPETKKPVLQHLETGSLQRFKSELTHLQFLMKPACASSTAA